MISIDSQFLNILKWVGYRHSRMSLFSVTAVSRIQPICRVQNDVLNNKNRQALAGTELLLSFFWLSYSESLQNDSND